MSPVRRFLAAAVLSLATVFAGPVLAAPIPIKVVVITTFEVGKDTGDFPGEFQHWAERMPLSHTAAIPGVEHPVHYSDDGVIVMVSGMRARPRESLAALILDPRFDVSHAYWIVAGIAGVDPASSTVGSAAWAKWVVDADPTYEVDDREMPSDWPWGIYALDAKRPGVKGDAAGSSGMVWKLNAGLVDWAYGLTKTVPLSDIPSLAAFRAGYASYPAAMTAPSVLIGDVVGTTRFWHGAKRTEWARDWVKIWTDGAGTFSMSDCEDQGVLDTLDLFAKSGKVDLQRVLVLRTASNFTQEPDGKPFLPGANAEGGFGIATEAAYRVGAPVVKALVAGWSRYSTQLPQP
jgi:purine nucleoside permease